jgi:hypothetical protein
MKRKTARILGLLVSFSCLLALFIPAIPTYAVVTGVNLMLSPSSQNASLGGAFTINVQAQCGSLTTNGIDVYLNFDPACLAIQSATPGTALPIVLTSPTYDNTAGTFGFGAGQLTQPPSGLSGTFTVVTLTFQAKSITTTPTMISFSTSALRKTQVIWNSDDITGSLTGATVGITADAPLYLDPANVTSIYSDQTFNNIACAMSSGVL